MSIVIGVLAAVFYFSATALFSKLALNRKNPAFAQGIALGGFVARLSLVSVIFYLFWRFFQVDLVTCLIAFIVVYTLLLPITAGLIARNGSKQNVWFSTRR